MEDDRSLRDEIKDLRDFMESGGKKKKPKKFRMPLSARVGKAKLKKGYVTVQVVDENRNIRFTREPIIDGTINLDQDTYHAVDENDIYFYKGKPIIIQPKHRINPYNPIDPRKETYGHKWIMAKMKSDQIGKKKMNMNVMLIFGLLIAAIAGYYFFFGGAGA